ncbi:MAG: DNA alkylation repair protein [Flavobacteriales bacterium]|nr:DNA alkylation repair protein [Flavobacteriales bacterium]
MTYEQIISRLHELANPEKIVYKENKFGVKTQNSLGIYHKDLNTLAREIGKNSELAQQLFDSGIYEARLLCSKICKPRDVTEAQMEQWVKVFDNWEICDSFCMALFAKNDLAVAKINEWSTREPEFEKRAAFATMAAYCMADKKADNSVFVSFFPIILEACHDERLYVKKAVNWALRSIGKRNIDLNRKAILLAKEILQLEGKAPNWIATDAIKELEKENVRMSDYPRAIYRP